MQETIVIFHNTDFLLPEENPFAMANKALRRVSHKYFDMSVSCIQIEVLGRQYFMCTVGRLA